MSLNSRLQSAVEHVKQRAPWTPSVGVVLGSGLGAFADSLEGLVKLPYREIPSMPSPMAAGHEGNLCLGTVGSARVACLQGRVHLYEGFSVDDVTFGVRLLARLGCRVVLISNAAGGVNPSISPGELMLIGDHLNLTGQNPLAGPPEPGGGPRYLDMTGAYDPWVRACARDVARKQGVLLREGVYAAMMGPSYETAAEIRMLRTLGADAVGMSTVPEVLALRHLGVRLGAVSCITNLGAGLSPTLIDHHDVEASAARLREMFVPFLSAWVARISEGS